MGKRIRIVSDGTRSRVLDADTGEQIGGVTKVLVTISRDKVEAVLTVQSPELDVIGQENSDGARN